MKFSIFKNIRVQFNLIIGLITLLAIFVVIQGSIQFNLAKSGRNSSSNLLESGIPATTLLIELQDDVLNMRIAGMGVIFGTDGDAMNAAQELCADKFDSAKSSLQTLKEMRFEDPAINDSISTMAAKIAEFKAAMEKIKSLLDQDDFFTATEIYDTELPPINEAVAKHLKALQASLTGYTVALGESNLESSVRANAFAKVFTLGSSLMTVSIAVFCYLLARRITGNLSSVITNLSDCSNKFKVSANALTESSHQLAEGASDQAATLEETSASVEELSSMIERDAEVARDTNTEASEASDAAQGGVRLLGDLRAGVEQVSDSAREMEIAMNEIKQSSDSISKVIQTIDEIAFQTNILALNAAVEAARAGEAGAGFAVVADEVRNLAHRAADAAQETAAMIESSIERSDRGVKVNERVNRDLKVVLEQAGQVETGLTNIVRLSAKTSHSMNAMEESAKEQADGIKQINSAVLQVNTVTQQNAISAEAAASTSVNLNTQADNLMQIVETLTSLINASKTDRKRQSTFEQNGEHGLNIAKRHNIEVVRTIPNGNGKHNHFELPVG